MISKITGSVAICLLAFIPNAFAGDVVDFAASLIGRPYAWGAEGPKSFDCSGLTQYVYERFGVDLPRRAISQSKIGDATGTRLQRGDLLFFSNEAGDSLVTHVGIYEEDGVMIDASKRHGKVRRDDLSESFWVDRFLFARRVSDLDSSGDVIARRDDPRDDDPVASPQRRSSDKRKIAADVIGMAVGILLKRPTPR